MSNTVAQRYAKGLFLLGLREKKLEKIFKDLDILEQICRENVILKNFLRNPFLSYSRAERIFSAFAEHARFSEISRNFLIVLSRNGRLSHLEKIIFEFNKRIEQHENIISGEVITARHLSPSQFNKLTRILSRTLEGTLQLKEKVDPTLLGGIVVQIGPYLLDTSLKMQFSKLYTALTLKR